MKKENTVLYVLRISLTLLIITAVVAGLLSVVNSITAPAIAKLQEQKTQAAIAEVIQFSEGMKLYQPSFEDETGLVKKVYAILSVPGISATLPVNGSLNGQYAVEVVVPGFGGNITMMVGVDYEGKVLGISIISHAETASLGSVAADHSSKGVAFRDQFVGKGGELAVTKDGGEIDAITGATITSRAVVEGVIAALACFENYGFGGTSE